MSDSFDELSARARRGELSRPEQQRLDTFLKASFEARVWHEAGRQLDAEDSVLPGDHAAVERVMQRALAALAPSERETNVRSSYICPASETGVRRGARRRWVLLLVAATLFGVSAAAASVQGVRWWRAHARELTVPAQVVAPGAPAAVPKRPAAARREVPSPLPAPSADVAMAAAPLVASVTSAESVATRSTPPAASHESQDAAALFSAAALARREGNAGKAVALLDSLQQRFPGSREARSSDMTLGSLHLQRGAAAAALEHFGRYLRAAPRGELASEALWGQAQALTALGRQSQAQERLRQLLERFPGSPYAAAARVKLELATP